MPRKKRWAVGR